MTPLNKQILPSPENSIYSGPKSDKKHDQLKGLADTFSDPQNYDIMIDLYSDPLIPLKLAYGKRATGRIRIRPPEAVRVAGLYLKIVARTRYPEDIEDISPNTRRKIRTTFSKIDDITEHAAACEEVALNIIIGSLIKRRYYYTNDENLPYDMLQSLPKQDPKNSNFVYFADSYNHLCNNKQPEIALLNRLLYDIRDISIYHKYRPHPAVDDLFY